VTSSEESFEGTLSMPHILVVDDDDAMSRMIRLTLVSEGYSVTTAGDGFEGLEALERQNFALIVLDLQMPRMDGREMFAEMQRRGIQIPVVVLSAYGAEAAGLELKAAGAITKPFDTAVLLERIKRIIGET
jgi:DNA-binding response OmpR family regulator